MKTFLILAAATVALSVSSSSCARRVVVVSDPMPVVRVAPTHHKIVVVRGRRYYSWDGNYYRKTRRGFIIVRL